MYIRKIYNGGPLFIPDDFVHFLKTGQAKNIYSILPGIISYSTANYHRNLLGVFDIKNDKIRVELSILKLGDIFLKKGDNIVFTLVQLPLIEDFEVRIHL